MAKPAHQFKKPTKRQVTRFLLNSFIIVLGNAIAAAGTAFFIIPNGFVMGGTTGLGIFVRNLISPDMVWREWVVSITVYTANIILFIIGAVLLGKKFAAATLAGTLLYPTFISIFTSINDRLGLHLGMSEAFGSPLFAGLCGSLIFGLGLGIVVRVGASTGGTDIPPLIFHKFFGTPVSVTLWIVDGSIILLQLFAKVDFDAILFGFVITLIISIVVEKISPIGMRRTQVKIISSHYEEIREMILTKISRGVTVLYGETGYLKADCRVLLTVISHRELVTLKSEVEKIDPQAFMMISDISEVHGRGFHSEGVDFLMPEKNLDSDAPAQAAPSETKEPPEPKEPADQD